MDWSYLETGTDRTPNLSVPSWDVGPLQWPGQMLAMGYYGNLVGNTKDHNMFFGLYRELMGQTVCN